MNENFIKLVDVNLVNIYDQRNTLNLSAQFCLDPNVIKFLIVNGVDLQHTSGEGMNSAHYAAAYNPNPKIIDELVQHGLDIKLPDLRPIKPPCISLSAIINIIRK